MTTWSFAKSIELKEHGYFEFNDASSKGNDVSFSNSASTKISHKKRSCNDSEDSYSAISKQLKDVASALKVLIKGVDANQLYEEVMKIEECNEFMLASAFDGR